MTSSNVDAVSAFIEGAPPGELTDVINDIKALTPTDPSLLEKALPALQKYNEDQLTRVRLPGASNSALVSQHSRLEDSRYSDTGSQSSFAFDHLTQKASDVRSYSLSSQHTGLISSLHKAFASHATEHYPASTTAVVPTDSDSTITILLAANKYSPNNFWNGRFRSTYTYSPSSTTLLGTIQVDVHYYEDGNVRLTTTKKVPETSINGGSAGSVVREIAKAERKYQEDLNRGFSELSESSFKSLRRQLPVTRQKIEWEKVGSYRAGREIGGGRA